MRLSNEEIKKRLTLYTKGLNDIEIAKKTVWREYCKAIVEGKVQ